MIAKIQKKARFSLFYAIVSLALKDKTVFMYLFAIINLAVASVHNIQFSGNKLSFSYTKLLLMEKSPFNELPQQALSHSCFSPQVVDTYEECDVSSSKVLFDGRQEAFKDTQANVWRSLLLAYEWSDQEIIILHHLLKNKTVHLSDHLFNRSAANVCSISLKYPLAASAFISANSTYLLINDVSSLRPAKGNTCLIDTTIKKLVWLSGKNLLALTCEGCLVTIDTRAHYYSLYKQNFKDMCFIDIAVDTAHRTQLVALTREKLIYINLQKTYGSCGSSITDKKMYKVIKNFDRPLSRRIWFCDNIIFVYEPSVTTELPGELVKYQLIHENFLLDLKDGTTYSN